MVVHFPEYPWVQAPLISVAPMRMITLARLASAVSNAGGLGFLAGGSDASGLEAQLHETKELLRVQGKADMLPVGVGFILWAGDKLLHDALPILEKYRPSAIWLFAPQHQSQYEQWTTAIRKISQEIKIWVQIGTVADAKYVVDSCKPDVLVVQGTDAGGHGLQQGASIISLLPEVGDAVRASSDHVPQLIAAGGIMDGRGVAAAAALGAVGVTLGTRYLATPEANAAVGYKKAVLAASDGGVNTARGKLYDTLRGTTDWPDVYGGRGVLNESWSDAADGLSIEENKRLYDEALKKGDDGWGTQARLTTYAGTGVGLVTRLADAASITVDVRREALSVLQLQASRFAG